MDMLLKPVRYATLALSALGASFAQAQCVDLNINTWEGYAPQELKQEYLDIMKAKHGLDVCLNISYISSQDEHGPSLRSGVVDMTYAPQNIPNDGRHRLIRDRLLLELDPDRIPNHKNVVPELQHPDFMTKRGKLYGIPFIRGHFAIMYNTAMVAEEPESWNVLWDPQYQGKTSIPDDVYDALIYSVALSEGVGRDDIFEFENLDTPAINAKLKSLAENANNFWSGVATAANAKGLALVPSWGFAIPELRKQGESWKIAYVEEGVTGYVDNIFVGAHVADDPDKLTAAYEWLNFSLSDKYQAHIVRGLASIPVTTTVTSILTADEITQFHLDDPSHFKDNIILWEPVPKHTSDGMKAIWRAASKHVRAEKVAAAEQRQGS